MLFLLFQIMIKLFLNVTMYFICLYFVTNPIYPSFHNDGCKNNEDYYCRTFHFIFTIEWTGGVVSI